MKVCPNCQQQYPDDNLNFCLNDGGVLTKIVDDAAPTVILNKARTTDQNWSYQEPLAPWQSQPPPVQQQQQHMMNQPWKPRGNDQTLPIISLILGVMSLLLTCWCGGFYFGIPALITGYMGMNNAKNNPTIYSGREMAIAGLILGVVSMMISLMIILVAIFGNL
jgi:hypothetical protein